MKKHLYQVVVTTVMLISSAAFAQLTETMDQYAEQSQGNYQPMNMGYAGFNSSLGMIQEAWLDPLQNLGEGQSKPAYSKYYWSPDLVLPIRIREGMITVVNFPEWEVLDQVFVGDKKYFSGQIYGPNTLMLYPTPGSTSVGVDTNVFVQGRSGNKYVFYVKSEGINTERLTNAIIDIEVLGEDGGSPSSATGSLGGSGGGRGVSNVNALPGDGKSLDARYTRRIQREDWLKSIPLDPSKFRFDIEIYVPNPDDVVIAPERVWRDDIFTYIDLGEKALNMVQRPIVTLIVERVETPIGFRTKGPNNRLIIVEGIGDMVMRSGKRMVCLKLRRSDEEGLQYVSYADDGNDWDVPPTIPAGKKAKAKDDGKPTGNNDVYGSKGGSDDSNAPAGMIHVPNFADTESGGAEGSGSGMSSSGAGMGKNAGNRASGLDVDYSKMTSLSHATDSDMKNPYASYKYGSAFKGQGKESLSIELGTDGDVKKLENLWKDLSVKYADQLGGYEPFYSVDAPADGQGKELFHLRVGPIDSLDRGDSICSRLGRSGVFCSVVRIQ